MAKIKLLLLALLFMAIPKGLYAYTTGQIVTFNHMTYKVTSSTLRTLAFLGPDESIVGLLEIPGTVGDNKGTTFTVTRVSFLKLLLIWMWVFFQVRSWNLSPFQRV